MAEIREGESYRKPGDTDVSRGTKGAMFHVKHRSLNRFQHVEKHLANQGYDHDEKYSADETASPADRKMSSQETADYIECRHRQGNRIKHISGYQEQYQCTKIRSQIQNLGGCGGTEKIVTEQSDQNEHHHAARAGTKKTVVEPEYRRHSVKNPAALPQGSTTSGLLPNFGRESG